MNCCKVSRLLSAYIDSELTGAEMLSIRDHMRTCSSCQREYESLKSVKRMCGIEVPDSSPNLEVRLLQAVHNTRSLPVVAKRPRRLAANLSLAMASVLLFGLATVFWTAAREPAAVSPSALSHEQETKAAPLHGGIAETASKNLHNSDQEVQQEREFVDGSNPLSGPASAIAYADR